MTFIDGMAANRLADYTHLLTFNATDNAFTESLYMRTILCVLLGLIAIFFALVGTTMPLTLPAQAATDRVYYKQFQEAAAYVDKNGKFPTNDTIRRMENASNGPSIWNSLSAEAPLDCDTSFTKAPTDRLIFSFWRGEWSECYAYPSGRTTLPRSVQSYLLRGAGISIAIYWLVAAAATWGAIQIRRKARALKLSA